MEIQMRRLIDCCVCLFVACIAWIALVALSCIDHAVVSAVAMWRGMNENLKKWLPFSLLWRPILQHIIKCRAFYRALKVHNAQLNSAAVFGRSMLLLRHIFQVFHRFASRFSWTFRKWPDLVLTLLFMGWSQGLWETFSSKCAPRIGLLPNFCIFLQKCNNFHFPLTVLCDKRNAFIFSILCL